MDAKEISKLIEEKIKSGKSKKQIFREFSKYTDEYTLARIISQLPDTNLRNKYLFLNKILVKLLIVSAIIRVLYGGLLLLSISVYALPLIVLFPLINIWFAVQINNFRGWTYGILGMFGLIGVINSLNDAISIIEKPSSLNFVQWGLWLPEFGLITSITFLAFYLRKKLTPNMGWLGPKQDKDGNYLL